MNKLSFICTHCAHNHNKIKTIACDDDGYFWFVCNSDMHSVSEMHPFHVEHLVNSSEINLVIENVVMNGKGWMAEKVNGLWEYHKIAN